MTKFANLKGYNHNLDFEQYLLENENLLSWMNNLIKDNQFTEEFLIKTRIYYDSWKCINNQKKLTPYFCFYWLYDREDYDSADDWTDYNQVYEYLKNKYDHEFIRSEFNRAIKDREEKENYS
jgi:hypothetical protein